MLSSTMLRSGRMSAAVRIASRNLNGLSVGVVKETTPGEKRVAIIPADVEKITKKGASVSVAKGAGAESGFFDAQYEAAGATIVADADAWKQGAVFAINAPSAEQLKAIEDRHLFCPLKPRFPEGAALVDQLAAQKATAISPDMLLRTLSRGQSFDILSSQAGIAGSRAVLEAANVMGRGFGGLSTPAGKQRPAKVIVCGAGVAGLAAIQTAKAMGAQVFAFDVREAAAEQVEAMGAKFLRVPFEEDGSGEGGYAKEMSAEWFEAAYEMLADECKDTNVVITTALIPGRKAPVLINQKAVDALPHGAVTVDLAAEAGGNVATTKAGLDAGGVHVTPNGVTCIGYTNMPSRAAEISSLLYSGNMTKLLLSMDKEGSYTVDTENDEAVRSMCVVDAGKKLEPYVPPPPPPPTEAQLAAAAEAEAAAAPPNPADVARKQMLMATGGVGAGVLLGAGVPPGGMLSTFALSVWVGSNAVTGVAHALHSPLMAVTNAISGMTIVGGMLQMGGGMLPHSGAQFLATSAVALSSVNLSGGFIVTKKMLDMFRRDDDPPEYFHYMFAPSAAAVGLYALSGAGEGMSNSLALFSGLGCVGGISMMANQETSRLAPILAMGGVGTGIAATLGTMQPGAGSVYAQLVGASAIGLTAGKFIADGVGPTELPEAVAGFHALVGLAATATAVGDFLVHDTAGLDGFHLSSIYMGAWMGSITFTGSCIAYGKLAEKLDSSPLSLPGKDMMNMGMGAASLVSLLTFANNSAPATSLTTGVLMSGALGLHMTASIGGADMPVVITLLNSYSGWALCAEGFILNQPVLTIVGALIGSSGAFLTKIMCDGMNRSLPSVILGGFGVAPGATVERDASLVHTEMEPAGVAGMLDDAERVLVVPGYGLAVAQAQGIVAEIGSNLTKKGKTVEYAVHPVAGRMPGQLNVLLAEAGVPYDVVLEMEEANEVMEDYDVVLIIGANDTVNRLAEEDPNCAIAGMPVIQVWNAKSVVMFKRSMATGYAGVDNPIFFDDHTEMCLGNADITCADIRDNLKPV